MECPRDPHDCHESSCDPCLRLVRVDTHTHEGGILKGGRLCFGEMNARVCCTRPAVLVASLYCLSGLCNKASQCNNALCSHSGCHKTNVRVPMGICFFRELQDSPVVPGSHRPLPVSPLVTSPLCLGVHISSLWKDWNYHARGPTLMTSPQFELNLYRSFH